ncbi:MAG: type II toxin-antitoxin system HicA family toxin [Chloroflexota bacterium]|nr:type II toxin-antitoxin system HicA family toxin [Chloroflexota bacterium]MDE2685556.1 type II toxin-antitoxin system HicA family toxin [Chloroflexota bacterium]
MTYREFTRKLRRLSCQFDRQGSGSHEIWMNTENRARASIPNWGGQDLKIGTMRGILRDLGISRDDFERA